MQSIMFCIKVQDQEFCIIYLNALKYESVFNGLQINSYSGDQIVQSF